MTAEPKTPAIRFLSWVTAINVVVAGGFAATGVISPGSLFPHDAVASEASLGFALYAAARALPLAVFVGWAIHRRHIASLIVLGALAGVIQFLDGAIGIILHDPTKTFGPWLIAAAQGYAVIRLMRSRWVVALPGTPPIL
jgi:hypothetical protein